MKELSLDPYVNSEHFSLPWSEVAAGVFALIGGALIWLLKKFGEQHIASIDALARELREMRRELNQLAERVKVVEVVQQHYKVDP